MSRWYPRHTIRSMKYLGTAGAVLGASGFMYSLGTVDVLHADSRNDKNTFTTHNPYGEVAKNSRIMRPRIVNESKGMQSPEILAQFGRRMPAPPGVGRIDATYVPLNISGCAFTPRVQVSCMRSILMQQSLQISRLRSGIFRIRCSRFSRTRMDFPWTLRWSRQPSNCLMAPSKPFYCCSWCTCGPILEIRTWIPTSPPL